MWADKTTPSLRGVEGRICTICRRLFPKTAAGQITIERCPDDRAALVDIRAFTDSGEDQLLGLTVAGRFTVLSKLGAGSMGTVYRARQEGVGRDVALKILRGERAYDASAKARFEREARANSVLASPYTVTVFDFGVAEDGALFLAMEMLEGESLGHRLRREMRLPPVEAVRFAREALASLSEAHAKGIIHRDIKPDNLFLSRIATQDVTSATEVCKVLDFGIAKVVRDDGGVDSLQTQAGTVFGTPRYMSPEQAQGKPLDARSDLYSLGIILYQMILGRPPFEDEDAVLVMARHIKSPPPPFREVAPDVVIPEALEQVIMRSLAKSPDDRPASAEQFIQLLDESMQTAGNESGVRRVMPALAHLSFPGVSAARKGDKRPLAAMIVGAVAVLGLVSAGVWATVARSKGGEASAAGVESGVPVTAVPSGLPASAFAPASAAPDSSGAAAASSDKPAEYSTSNLPPVPDGPKKSDKGSKDDKKKSDSKKKNDKGAGGASSKYGKFE
jgi:serine/threonine-protein kinase